MCHYHRKRRTRLLGYFYRGTRRTRDRGEAKASANDPELIDVNAASVAAIEVVGAVSAATVDKALLIAVRPKFTPLIVMPPFETSTSRVVRPVVNRVGNMKRMNRRKQRKQSEN
jgi:hypothetical protein